MTSLRNDIVTIVAKGYSHSYKVDYFETFLSCNPIELYLSYPFISYQSNLADVPIGYKKCLPT